MKWLRRTLAPFALLFGGPLYMALFGNVGFDLDWRTADRSSAGIAPDPVTTPQAVVQVYAARAFGWRGIFGVHTWIATKAERAPEFTVHEVMGWRLRRSEPVVVSHDGIPDRNWFGSRPATLVDLRGEAAAAVIPTIERAVREYPFPFAYSIWPGPNSNTFTAWVARAAPELTLVLPTTAIGKDYLGSGQFFARAPSGTGYQLSLFGLLGVLAARHEGLELNVLGLNFGIDPWGPALMLPGVGRLGFGLDRPARAPG